MTDHHPFTPFTPFPKIPRYSRDVIVTEKIDGTNAQICISDDGKNIIAGSRKRWITPQDDHYGFARWVEENREELLTLGPGSHFGEWWGKGIQRGYDMTEKVFSLFNTHRWVEGQYPSCCRVVPVLWAGNMNNMDVAQILIALCSLGSQAAPGFPNPEGIVIYHIAGGVGFKKTIKKDEEWKGKSC